MNRRDDARAIAVAWLIGGIAVPTLLVVARLLFGRPGAVVETMGGGAVGALLLASTAIVALLFVGHGDLKTAVLYSYVTKVTVLIGLVLVVPRSSLDAPAFGLGMAVGAVAYLAVTMLVQGRAARSDP